jgi:hypothetical protein
VPKRDPRSEPGDVPEGDVLRGPRTPAPARAPSAAAPIVGEHVAAFAATPAKVQSQPSSELRDGLPAALAFDSLAPVRPSSPPSEEDLLADLTAKVLLEEKMRRTAEQRVQELTQSLAETERERDRALGELRGTTDGLRQELLALEQARATERRASELELERVRAEAAAELAALRARRVPSVRSMVAIREEAHQEVAQELALVRRTADEALAALRRLVERKESALEEGRAELERLRPGIVQRVLSRTPGRGVPAPFAQPIASVPSDYPEVRIDEDER